MASMLMKKGDRTNTRVSGGQRSGRGSLSHSQLQPLAREVAESLSGVSHSRPFVESLNVYKVGSRVFMIFTDNLDERITTLKADQDQASALRDHFQTVNFGCYFDKGHWVSVGAGRGITRNLITQLVRFSYQLVIEAMPALDRPKMDTV